MLTAERKLQVYKESLMLEPIQKDLVIGSLLGDGNIRFVARNREATFVVDHSVVQRDYVQWKYQLLRTWVLTEPKTVSRTYHKNRERQLTSFRFSTMSHPELTFWYNVFYRDGIKIIPANISEILVYRFLLRCGLWMMETKTIRQCSWILNSFLRKNKSCCACASRKILELKQRSINTGYSTENSCIGFEWRLLRRDVSTHSSRNFWFRPWLINSHCIPVTT